MEAESFWLSVGAVAISIVFAIRQERLSRKVASIEEDRRREEVTRRLIADVTAVFESKPRRGSAIAESHYLVLINRGPAKATDVDFEHPDTDGMPTFFKDDMGFPIALEPHQRFPVLATPFYGGSAAVPITLRWTDGRGRQEKQLLLASP